MRSHAGHKGCHACCIPQRQLTCSAAPLCRSTNATPVGLHPQLQPVQLRQRLRRSQAGTVTCSLHSAARRSCYAAGTAAAVLLAAATASADVDALFNRNCAGCHAGGGNVVQAGASLSTTDLRRNGVDDPKALFDLIYGGKGRMPGYGEKCAPKGRCTFGKRLDDEQVQQLAEYTLQQAATGWK